ncbi:MAG TPA: hypothetical protein VGG18_09265 [Granulicella sp.]|jgi:hypothetical protein
MMTRLRILATVLAAATLASASVHAQTTDDSKAHKKAKHPAKAKAESATEVQLRELREEMHAQQSEIETLKSQLAGKDQQATTAQQSAAEAQSQAAAAAAAAAQANSAAAESSSKVDTLQTTVNDLKTTNTGLTETVVSTQQHIQEQIDSPTAIRYKGVTITPVAFFAAEGVWRERSVNSDVNTPFNSIPLPSANQGHVSELNFSGRQSRLGLLVEGNAGAYKLSGYFEGDFLGSGTTSNNNQSNSYVFRQRQFWGKAETQSGFAVTGGQMWSLVTEDGKSTDNRTEKLPNTVDAQYMVGFSWARQAGFRFQKRFGDIKTGAVTVAASLEQAQITNFTATSSVAAAVPTNYFFSGTGQNGGLYNAFNGTYANNVAPDIIVKAAYDLPKAHFELGGLARFLRDYYYPITAVGGTAAAPTYTYSSNYSGNTVTGGGVFASARISPFKFADFAVQGMGGDGVGRYGSAQLADATLRPDGTLEPLHNYHGLLSIETHPMPKLDVYAYYGGEYAQRTVYKTALGDLIGYGAPNLSNAGCYNLPTNPASSTGGSPSASGCASPTRYIQEGMIGFTYRAVNSPKFGRLQYQLTYQYVQRNLWSGVGSATTPTGPRAEDNMVLTSMRYYIP